MRNRELGFTCQNDISSDGRQLSCFAFCHHFRLFVSSMDPCNIATYLRPTGPGPHASPHLCTYSISICSRPPTAALLTSSAWTALAIAHPRYSMVPHTDNHFANPTSLRTCAHTTHTHTRTPTTCHIYRTKNHSSQLTHSNVHLKSRHASQLRLARAQAPATTINDGASVAGGSTRDDACGAEPRLPSGGFPTLGWWV